MQVMTQLHKRGAKVSFHDPYVETVVLNGVSIKRNRLTRRALSGSDCVAILAPHRSYDVDWVAEHAGLIFDARNAFSNKSDPKIVRL
jgi:UDP-N-acetyl-D-glucosamine dehydrogenase